MELEKLIRLHLEFISAEDYCEYVDDMASELERLGYTSAAEELRKLKSIYCKA